MTTEQMDEKDDYWRDRIPLHVRMAADAEAAKQEALADEALCDDPDCPRPHGHEDDDEWLTRAVDRLTELGYSIAAPGAEVQILNPDEPAPDLDPEQHFGNEHEIDTGIVDITRHSEDTMRKVDQALFEAGVNGVNARSDIITALQNAGILFRERAPEYEPVPADEPASEHPGISDEFWEKVPPEEREAFSRFLTRKVTVKPEEYVTFAEEPIEQRLRRSWLNGFRDGVDRASFAATESTGRWDY